MTKQSELDEILVNLPAYSEGGTLTVEEMLTYFPKLKEAKEAIKALILELIGEDRYDLAEIGDGYQIDVSGGYNHAKAELRKKVEEL